MMLFGRVLETIIRSFCLNATLNNVGDLFYRQQALNDWEKQKTSSSQKWLLHVWGGIGDLLMAEPVARAIKQNHLACEVHVSVAQRYVALAKGLGFDKAWPWGTGRIGYQQWPDKLIENQQFDRIVSPVLFPTQAWKEKNKMKLHQLDYYAYKCGVSLKSRRPQLHIPSHIIKDVEQFIIHSNLEKFIVVAFEAFSTGNWPFEKYDKWIQLMHKTCPSLKIVLVSGKTSHKLKGTMKICDQSLLWVGSLLDQAVGYFGPDTGIAWLAASRNVKTLVLNDKDLQKLSPSGPKSGLKDEGGHVIELGSDCSLGQAVRSVKELL